MEIMKPVVLKAGIPLAVALLAGFALAKIATRQRSPRKASSSLPKCQANARETEYREMLGLKCNIEEFLDRQCRLEKRFLNYQDLKEQEIALMELHNKLVLEMNRVEFLEREISLLEAGKQRFDDIVWEYSEILKCKEMEISKYKIELEAKGDRIRLMEDEMRELKMQIELLVREKNEISCKLGVAEESAKSKAEGELATIENYNQLAHELDRLQKDEASEVKESIYVRWRNACLRHELMRRNREQEQNYKEIENNFGGIVEIEEFGSDNELNGCNVGQTSDSSLGLTTLNHDHSKRHRLIEKFRRWVEKDKHGKNKCFRRRFVSDGANETYFSARKSCSSA